MRVVHEPTEGDAATLAGDVDVADTFLTQMRGLMFRSSVPDDYALVFEFSKSERRSVHMLFVPFPIDVVWTDDGRVTQVRTLKPWRGLAYGTGDRIVELPEGAASGVRDGDVLRVEA